MAKASSVDDSEPSWSEICVMSGSAPAASGAGLGSISVSGVGVSASRLCSTIPWQASKLTLELQIMRSKPEKQRSRNMHTVIDLLLIFILLLLEYLWAGTIGGKETLLFNDFYKDKLLSNCKVLRI